LPRLTIGRRFGVVALLVIPLVTSVCVIGALGVIRMNDRVTELYHEGYRHTLASARLSRGLSAVEVAALRTVLTNDRGVAERAGTELDRRLLPAVDTAFAAVRAELAAEDRGHHLKSIRNLSTGLEEFERLRDDEAFEFRDETEAVGASKDRLAARLARLFDRVVAEADDLVEVEAAEARSIAERARAENRKTLLLLLGGSLVALLGTLAVIAWLTRSIVPRARGYSRFAAEVANGSTDRRLEPAGHDELSELGLLLNRMVDHREREEHQLDQQTEFSEAMQMTESEHEAYGLLKRHLERSLGGSEVTVLGRNNSADRLEPRTPLQPGAALAAGLQDARPRSCLAVRTGEQQNRTNGEAPLMECDVCGKLGPSACQPLLVGGEVMGSVLALPEGSLAPEERETMRLSVAQAAPILANLRNLAIAEQRAGTDELTGLANQRSANDAVKRMAAEASADAPLAAIVLDLDHFKQINDLYGHGAGDEVLAAVGAALRTTLRPDDFCSRWGGEEFLLLLPDADTEGARSAAENLRAAVGGIRVASVQREISASLGVAVLPVHASDAIGVVRSADRALYAAKAAGRNRVEVFTDGHSNGAAKAAEIAAPAR
jgi:diguanylate cyclase (GGDEF)-like protein